ncbi:ATP-binding cassette domain-containing protein [Microbacterium sp. G2-8]|uniref:ATP-binding cassette domain-containing protein n=1 Tax=Microbacterium sp. G2-8 TaxID=2842454 RepID=UPI001C89F6C9|nr:ATP-binding cassette domain-containing protein [Microbacterium sp. G2-8]
MSHAIQVRGLRKRFGSHTVLDGLDLSVAPGEIFALLGPNGAGKTTIVEILTTLSRPDGGTAEVAGYDVTRAPRAVQQRISLTGQSATVDDALTARENIVMFARLWGLGSRAAHERAVELLAQFGLTEAGGRRVATFSGGMRRRLDLSLSVVVRPEVLFLDEPTTGLDTRSRRELWEEITALATAGTTVFLTTQYLEEADQLADRVAVLHDGRIVALGTPSELKARVGGATLEVHGDDGSVIREVPTDGSVDGLRDVLADLQDTGTVTLRRPTLDDVFLALTGEARQKESA